ncbi:uncharacterized protein NFIA_041620 [Aspergillus fischeri NRRL 181]|uniref:Uncharacterized protein n=1 Tax=Neosartorya fischeri (strain ATCC 1020 / DSM 3700 / CBS 544.65 / FGSC A1164 / JCM 1740 / NRRL 181 / WB 181) TaxID=331117 RepID=A1D0R4_NEOFI|nr:uncharacterized protein NFIA_041620 [Aspergillus fischeri NRRL 181]EAW24584.1 hypothetical protein NFIA_041620 [Aspergillus fischeri NRRL 181]
MLRGYLDAEATFIQLVSDSSFRSHFNILRLTIPIQYAGDVAYTTWVDQLSDGVLLFKATMLVRHLQHLKDMDDAARFLFLNNSLAHSPDAIC